MKKQQVESELESSLQKAEKQLPYVVLSIFHLMLVLNFHLPFFDNNHVHPLNLDEFLLPVLKHHNLEFSNHLDYRELNREVGIPTSGALLQVVVVVVVVDPHLVPPLAFVLKNHQTRKQIKMMRLQFEIEEKILFENV